MKARALFFALFVGVVSMTSGCQCFRCMFPYAGWRFHEGWWGHGCPGHGCPGHGCAPCDTCAPCGPACGPIAYRPPVVVPGGSDCAVGPSISGAPQMTYPPIIGNPMPLFGGGGVIPNNQLPAPMPDKEKKKDGY